MWVDWSWVQFLIVMVLYPSREVWVKISDELGVSLTIGGCLGSFQVLGNDQQNFLVWLVGLFFVVLDFTEPFYHRSWKYQISILYWWKWQKDGEVYITLGSCVFLPHFFDRRWLRGKIRSLWLETLLDPPSKMTTPSYSYSLKELRYTVVHHLGPTFWNTSKVM